MESPEIQLFNEVFIQSLELGYQTVDYAAQGENGIHYPFVHVSESISDDVINNKEIITGRLSQTIHVWGYANDRDKFSNMVFQLKQRLRGLTRLSNYFVNIEALNSNAVFDSTTDDDLLHGIIQVEYELS
ncbi:hypothetical protein [Halobacillus massiliensis]|uniref:hypothetical protein n=1 Tax=Halobacillus massiliensis TaxID=1926286 RepID=UPI0009E5B2F0|nr:hypothetical protein [Halobacillus massiliensis]